MIASIQQELVWEGRTRGPAWFHPRPCLFPCAGRRHVFMTLQDITGSDVFGPVHWSTSSDEGRIWSAPEPIPGLGRHPFGAGFDEGVCDVVPQYHPPTDTLLAVGHNVFYKDGSLAKPQPGQRYPVYVVRNARGEWTPPRRLGWDDPRAANLYTCGCGQRLVSADGTILMPLRFRDTAQAPYLVATARCHFDGSNLTVAEIGPALALPHKRGLMEPSFAAWGGRYYLTLRAEDGHGYVSVSDDGMRWRPIQAWMWEDGEALAMSTTQQHWLVHSDALFLVYTRRDRDNAEVFRWRSPLYIARVDPDTLRLVRSSERIAIPMSWDGAREPQRVAHLGNFHTGHVSEQASLVTVGETVPAAGFRGNTLQARIVWERPNRANLFQ